jgi:DNA-binding PadR family transcriptional regulator
MILLAVLAGGNLHAYAVIAALRQRSGGRFEFSEGTAYPALHRLEHLGLITSSWSAAEGKQRRVYGLTPAGQDKLAADRGAWLDYVTAVNGLLDTGSLPSRP